MSLTRRGFLKGATAGSAVCALSAEASAEVREAKTLPPKAVGLLFDSTLCVGCKACVTACRNSNGTKPEYSTDDKLWDTPLDISAYTLTVIKAYSEGTGEHKDEEKDGYAFIKKSCLHCVDPSCVSVCPVGAMTKDKETGIVSYDPDICIGCRYCVAACPFEVPRFEYDKTFARLRKCELCKHQQAVGRIPACAWVCPTGATLFGPVRALNEEAHRRLALKPGEKAFYPRKTVNSTDVHEKPAPHYLPEVYGETELGGLQMQLLAGVSYQKLGYPTLKDTSFVAQSETIQHTIYRDMVAPLALFSGLLYLTHRTASHDDKGEE